MNQPPNGQHSNVERMIYTALFFFFYFELFSFSVLFVESVDFVKGNTPSLDEKVLTYIINILMHA